MGKPSWICREMKREIQRTDPQRHYDQCHEPVLHYLVDSGQAWLMIAAFKAYGIVGIAIFFVGHILVDFSLYILISFLASCSRKLMNERAYKVIVIILALVLSWIWNQLHNKFSYYTIAIIKISTKFQ